MDFHCRVIFRCVCRTGFTRVNKIETMSGRLDVNVKVARGSTFTFTRGFSHIVSTLFTHGKPVKIYVRTNLKITRQWKSTISLFNGKVVG